MRVGVSGFVPNRLKEARAARRVPSMSALARDLSMNPSTISRWEDGTSSPDTNALSRLAEGLRVRQEFFLRPSLEDGRSMFFRSLSSTYVRDLDYQRAQILWLQEISSTIGHYIDFPDVDVPEFLNGASYKQLRDEDIEQIAGDLRRYWNIGDGPCVDLIDLMERIGIIVSCIEMGTSKLDGLCSWSSVDNRPHILLSTDKMSFARRQMNAAHELSHIVLHAAVEPEEFKRNIKVIEAQAFRLASALLLPATTYPIEVKTPSLSRFLVLKDRWRVSVKAQIKRMADLGILDEDFVTHLYKLYSAKGWSKEEPLDAQWALTEPRILADALQLIVDEGVRSKEDLLSLEFTVPAGDVERLCSLPSAWFSRQPAKIVRLQHKQADDRKKSVQGVASVLHFPKDR